MNPDIVADPDVLRPGPQEPGLRWRIKLSFLRYVTRMPDGRCSVTDGAAVAEEEAFHFSPAPGSAFDPGTLSGDLRFRGDVRFAGHHGLLFVQIADPWLTVDRGAATLSIAVASDRIALAALRLERGPGPYLGTDVRLTEDGSDLFNAVYPAGELLDDLTVLLPCDTRLETNP